MTRKSDLMLACGFTHSRLYTTFLTNFLLSFLPFLLTIMPRSKKGRLTGAARKEINEKRAHEAISGNTKDIAFARVTKILGANHVEVSINAKHGPRALHARIPNIFARRGATPITTRDVVTIYVGNDFDPDEPIGAGSHFDITAILTHKQAYSLHKEGSIAAWMIHEDGGSAATEEKESGFEFDHSGVKAAEGSDEESDAEEGAVGFSRKTARLNAISGGGAEEDDDVDVDHI